MEKSVAMGRPPLPIKGGAGVDVTAASRTALKERCISPLLMERLSQNCSLYTKN